MSALPAYERSFELAPDRYYDAPDIQVVPGRRPQVETLSPSFIALAKLVAAVALALAIVGIACIALNAASVTVSLESKNYDTLIDQAREEGSLLEVSQSTLSNPTRIKAEANALGMAAPETSTKITLAPDVVATTDAGELSLSSSLAVVAGN